MARLIILALHLAALALGSTIVPRQCAIDACNQQVGGVDSAAPPAASRSRDCSSLLAVTVTPATRTITSTLWVPPIPSATPSNKDKTGRTDVDQEAIFARQVAIPSYAIPPYASACDNNAKYASACGCIGVTGSTVTGRAPRTTTTVTAIATDCPSLAVREVPVCAHACLRNIAPAYGCKGLEDLACECANFEPIAEAVTPCVSEACSRQELELVYPGAAKGCACFVASNPRPVIT